MTGMQANAAGTPGKVSYYGWVTIGESPCPGAIVKLNYNGVDHTTTTKTDGSYNIGPIVFAEGAQPEISTIWGGQTLSRATPNTDAMVNKQSFDFPPAVIFKGSVLYNGVPVGGAMVTVKYGGYMWTFATDSDGNYKAGAFYYGGQATLMASYSGRYTDLTATTPQQDSTIVADFAIDGASASSTTQQYFFNQGKAYYNGNPVSGIEILYTYMGDINRMNAGNDGSYNFSVQTGSGNIRSWARYNGIDSPVYMMAPSAGQTYTHDFYIVASASATPTPLQNATVAATSTTTTNPQNQNPGVSTTPTVSPSKGPAVSDSPALPGLLAGIPTVYLLVGLGVIVIILIAAAVLVLRK